MQASSTKKNWEVLCASFVVQFLYCDMFFLSSFVAKKKHWNVFNANFVAQRRTGGKLWKVFCWTVLLCKEVLFFFSKSVGLGTFFVRAFVAPNILGSMFLQALRHKILLISGRRFVQFSVEKNTGKTGVQI